MSEGANSADVGYQSYHATYCEVCGTIARASDEIKERVEEPIHRVDILEALGESDEVTGEVKETCALEQGVCQQTGCDGQLVQRYYAVGEVPEPEVDIDEGQIQGRDPAEDAMIDLPDKGLTEVKDVPWLADGDDL